MPFLSTALRRPPTPRFLTDPDPLAAHRLLPDDASRRTSCSRAVCPAFGRAYLTPKEVCAHLGVALCTWELDAGVVAERTQTRLAVDPSYGPPLRALAALLLADDPPDDRWGGPASIAASWRLVPQRALDVLRAHTRLPAHVTDPQDFIAHVERLYVPRAGGPSDAEACICCQAGVPVGTFARVMPSRFPGVAPVRVEVIPIRGYKGLQAVLCGPQYAGEELRAAGD